MTLEEWLDKSLMIENFENKNQTEATEVVAAREL